MPLIEQRRALVSATLNKGTSPLVNAKKALLEKLTKLFTIKLVKAKGVKGGIEAKEAFEALAQEVKRSPNAAHVNACSLGMISCLKTGSLGERAKEVYTELMKEWSVKKSSNLQTGLFEDIIERAEDSPALLLESLVKGVKEGRNDFIKGEIYRLIGKMFSGKRDGEFYTLAQLKAIVGSLNESLAEGLKTKRIRLVLVCCEKIIEHGKTQRKGESDFWECLEMGLVEGLMMLASSKSKQVVKSAKSLVESIAEGVAESEGGKKGGKKKKREGGKGGSENVGKKKKKAKKSK